MILLKSNIPEKIQVDTLTRKDVQISEYLHYIHQIHQGITHKYFELILSNIFSNLSKNDKVNLNIKYIWKYLKQCNGIDHSIIKTPTICRKARRLRFCKVQVGFEWILDLDLDQIILLLKSATYLGLKGLRSICLMSLADYFVLNNVNNEMYSSDI